MTLRVKLVAYFLFLHAFAIFAVVYFWPEYGLWAIAVEIVLAISAVIAFKLHRALFRPIELLLAGADALKEKDFTTRLRPSGQPEMDALISVYNRMIDSLRDKHLALEEQHFFLEKVMKASPAGMITLDYDGLVTMVNPAAEQLLQSPAHTLIGKPLKDSGTPFALQLAGLPASQAMIIPLRGTRRVKCSRSTFMDRGFPRTFFLLEELTEELRQTEKSAYERVIRMMSHEVNNSIGAANSLLHSSLHYKDQLKESDREDFVSALNIAISRTEHLNAFMKSFADIIRLPKSVKQEVELGPMLEEICRLMRPECLKRNIDLSLETDSRGPATVNLDRSQMEQVFVNLIKNAMEAINGSGKIVVRMARRDSKPVVTVNDSGRGIEAGMKHLIFTPFFSTKEGGQGIGLTLVQEILTQHQFEYSLESEPGKPTSFSITLA